jgi:D-glycero-alpha-D-manno-heptose-7-phosphate kinase
LIISRTPFRISLFGGGTDYPSWYLDQGGAVIGTAIDKYCYISVRELPPFFEYRHRVAYSRIELANSAAEIEHPAVRAVLGEFEDGRGFAIHHDGDLPARSGLGSSSSFTVGLLNALHAAAGRMAGKGELAREALRIEQTVLREAVGSQDQIWAAFGGINRIDFHTDGGFDVQPLRLQPARKSALDGSLLLFFTGLSRVAAEVASKKIANLGARARQLKRMRAMVDEAQEILLDPGRDLYELGALLRESWALKRELADAVSNSRIDEIHAAGMEAGAAGGKLLGAGGGGFMLFLVAPERQAAVIERLKPLVPVSVRTGAPGSRIVVYEPGGLGSV